LHVSVTPFDRFRLKAGLAIDVRNRAAELEDELVRLNRLAQQLELEAEAAWQEHAVPWWEIPTP
jgi:hypothetical protein